MILVNGIDCEDLNIVFSELPTIPKALRRIEEKEVSGRDGLLNIDKGSYANIQIMLNGHAECTRTELVNYFGDFGELSFKTSIDKFWKYRVVDLSVMEILDDGVLISFSITLNLDPYKYLVKGQNKITGLNSITLNNEYNSNAYPLITIQGTGDISISKNRVKVMTISGVTDYVTVDCALDVVHRNNVSYDNRTTGDIFYIDSNKTTVLTFNGRVTGFTLRPNWREL